MVLMLILVVVTIQKAGLHLRRNVWLRLGPRNPVLALLDLLIAVFVLVVVIFVMLGLSPRRNGLRITARAGQIVRIQAGVVLVTTGGVV